MTNNDPLNKISVLDKGFVSLICSANPDKTLQPLQKEYFNDKINKAFLNIASATLHIKCPLFMQLQLSQYDLDLMQLPTKNTKLDFYIPDVSEINTGDLEVDMEISEYVDVTSEALEMTSKGFAKDGCDKHMAQILIPVNTYTELIVHGSLKSWIEFVKRTNAKHAVESYRKTIDDILKAEWKDLDIYKKA
jgi:hypothetical protein